MSFSIPTLRAYRINTGGSLFLDPPTIGSFSDVGGTCSSCLTGVITAPVGSVVRFNLFYTPGTVSCSSYVYSTTGNIAYFKESPNGSNQDEFGCLTRVPSGVYIHAISCSGATSSTVSTTNFAAVACRTPVAPTITVGSKTVNGFLTTLNYTVTSNDCTTTYFNDSDGAPNYTFCGQPPNDPTDTSYKYSISGSGTTSTTKQLTCTTGSTYNIRAITYYTNNNCTTTTSSVTLASGAL
jgi:hypothetical protein